MPIQRERAEAIALVRLVAGKWWALALHHSPNEELNKTARQFAAAQGTRPGFPDYILPVRSGEYAGLALELKAIKPYGSAVTAAQRAWLDHFEREGWRVAVCYGAEEALEELGAYMRARNGTKQ